jgi:O-6-methylguanine DNA methyltransferase
MSDFKKAVITIVSNIPKGTVLSYKEVAIAVKSPKAARAVATIMASNYNPDVPCHRVIRSDGGLGGYNRGGVSAKAGILKSEGVVL